MYGPGDSALRRWLRDPYQLDGWRVDVSNMLGRDGPLQVNLEVLREMRLAVKAENPDAYFMGENFQDATDQLQGDIWDGVMNYSGFFTPLVNWLTGFSRGALGFNETIFSPQPLTTAALVQSWKERLGVVPWVLNLQQFNMLGSHDTTRITSMLKDSLALYHLALGFQMTFPGVPCVFYGNEIGMLNPTENSAAAAGARTCMEWDSSRWDMHSLALYRELIALRRQRKALADGGFQLLRCAADGFIYQRKCGGDVVLFTANRAAAPWQPAVTDAVAAGLPDGLRLRQFRGNQRLEVSQQQLRWPVLPQGGIIWLSE